MSHPNSTTRKLVDYIRSHPGATRAKMLEALADGTNPRTVSSALNILSRGGAIENRGRAGRAARWFSIELTVDGSFRKIARQLLSELKEVHHSQREEYLAKRLQELFGSSSN
jgi:hypothetical protein